MKAIKTKYLGATDLHGSRIRASDEDGNSFTVGYPHEMHEGADAHSVAAVGLCVKMGWLPSETLREWQHTHLIGGGLKDCYVFVFARNPENRDNIYKLPTAKHGGV